MARIFDGCSSAPSLSAEQSLTYCSGDSRSFRTISSNEFAWMRAVEQVVLDRPTKSISVEDTFDRDVSLSETEPMIRRLAEKVWSASRKESRIARTVVLKLKTSQFNILTRSHTPGCPPSSCDELTAIALTLRERVELSTEQRFRLVGIGLSNFREPKATQAQRALFE